jgi:hypothetical protein
LQTATEIAQLQQQNKLPPILVLFLGEEKQVPDFLGSSKLRASYKILNPADFFPLLQKNPPRIILLWNGNVLGDWDQDSFSLQKLKETLLKTG